MLRQLWALMALKLSILRHTWTARKGASMVVMGLITVIGFVAAAGAAYGLYNLGTALPDAPPRGVLVTLDGVVLLFLFFWLFGLIMDLQRADMIDVRKMLYLPVSLPAIYGLNYLASLLSPGLVFFTLGVVRIFVPIIGLVVLVVFVVVFFVII